MVYSGQSLVFTLAVISWVHSWGLVWVSWHPQARVGKTDIFILQAFS